MKFLFALPTIRQNCKRKINFITFLKVKILHFHRIFSLLLKRVRDILQSGDRKSFHIFHACNRSVKSITCERIIGIDKHPTFEIFRVAVRRSHTRSNKCDSMIGDVEEINKAASTQNVIARRARMNFLVVNIPNKNFWALCNDSAKRGIWTLENNLCHN